MTPDEATQLCEMIAKFRAFAIPEVPRTGTVQANVAVSEPAMSIQCLDTDQQKMLSIRHPGYGWVSFVLSEVSSQMLSDAMATKPPVVVVDPPNKRQLH